jgi:TatD DNase family protein
MLIDTHCHLDFDRFDDDREAVVRRAEEAGVRRIIVPALDLQNCQNVLDLASKYAHVYAAVGVHPNSTSAWEASWLDQVRRFAHHPKVVAIGEIGIDYYWDDSPKEIQHKSFSAQLNLAADLDLPVIIHNRDAGEDVIRLLAKSRLAGGEKSGVLHSFSADWHIAEAALEMGFYIGITGPVTFKKADGLRDIVAKLPLNRILVETDAPFLAPQPRRGKRNEPSYVTFVAEQIALLHDLSIEELSKITTANAHRLFGQMQLDRIKPDGDQA